MLPWSALRGVTGGPEYLFLDPSRKLVEITYSELMRLVSSSIYFLVAFLGGVYIGYLLGFIDGSNNF